jgi:cell wall assembly regulator SMI1
MATKKVDLGSALKRLDAAVTAGDPAVAKTLAAGASAATLTTLKKTVGALPDELSLWFGWHDGQKGSLAIVPSGNDRLMSAKAVGSAWKRLAEEAALPRNAEWLPILENGAGDYVMYDRAKGHLVRYYHDETMRPKAASSLAQWALEVADAWSAVKVSEQPATAPEGWAPTAIPKSAALKKMPAGTALYFRATSPSLGKGVFFHLFWKQKADTWFQAANSTLDQAWLAISNNHLPFQATPDRGMEFCLGKSRVFVDGEGAGHAGLFLQHFAKPPFPTAASKR